MGRKHLVHTKRKYRIKFRAKHYRVSDARVAELPESGTARQYAVILGLDPMRMHRWIYQKGLPATKASGGQTAPWTIQKASFIDWLYSVGYRGPFESKASPYS